MWKCMPTRRCGARVGPAGLETPFPMCLCFPIFLDRVLLAILIYCTSLLSTADGTGRYYKGRDSKREQSKLLGKTTSKMFFAPVEEVTLLGTSEELFVTQRCVTVDEF